jgi:hypothetical protein
MPEMASAVFTETEELEQPDFSAAGAIEGTRT